MSFQVPKKISEGRDVHDYSQLSQPTAMETDENVENLFILIKE
jgi:hypothetical protein